jgi:hypothetical protein
MYLLIPEMHKSKSDIRTIIQTWSYLNKMKSYLSLQENEDVSHTIKFDEQDEHTTWPFHPK